MPRILTTLSLGGDRARELAARNTGMQLGGDRAIELAARKFTSANSATSAPTLQTDSSSTSNSILQQLLERLVQPQTNEFSPFPEFQGSKQSAEQRAASLVASKYNGKIASVGRAQQQVSSNLAQGVTTQNAYGNIGDAKLKDIYSNLTGIAQGTADKTSALYADAKTQVAATYDTSAQTQAAVATQTQGDVANVASQFGLGAAVKEATKHMTDFQSGSQSQLATERASGVSNIITLGANMGAAALKDVNIMAQLGADSRRDLINSVQGTIASLQKQAADQQAELQGQMLDLENSRAEDMQSATYQFQADDAEKASKYAMEKLKYEFENNKFAYEKERNNLEDILKVFEAEEKQLTGEAARSAAGKAAQLAQSKFKHDVWKDNASVELDNKEFGLSVDKFKLDKVDTFADNDRQARKDFIDAKYDQQKLALNSTQFNSQEERLRAEAKIDNARADEKLGVDKGKAETAADKEARESRESTVKAAATREKDRRDAEKGEVLLKKAKIDLEIAKQKLAGPTGSVKKYAPGLVGVNSYTADLNTGNKGEGTAIRRAFDSLEATEGAKLFAGDSKMYDRVRAKIMTDPTFDQDMRDSLLLMAAIQHNDYTTKAK